MLERNDWLGGAIKTVDGLTAPGFTHEVFSSWHPLWVGSPAYAELKPDLDALGLEYLNTDLPTAAAFPDGSSAFLSTDGAANVAELGEAWQRQFDEFMAGADIAFGVLGTELWSGAGLLARPQGLLALRPPRPRRVRRPLAALRARLADRDVRRRARPRPARAVGAAHRPRPRPGDVRLHDAGDRLRAPARRDAGAEGRRRRSSSRVWPTIIRDAGGELRTETDVERILVSEGRATAVRLADGESIPASRAVLACVTPTQLYGRLLGESDAPKHVRDAARRFRYGRGEMQIHIAMNELPRWRGDERLARTPLLHLTPGLDGVSRAVNEADRGLLPAEATIALGQPMALDPSRAPDGSWVIWVQLQELPPRPKGDAAGELDTSTARGPRSCARRTPTGSSSGSAGTSRTSTSATIGRVVMSPADMEAANPNWVGGDIYAGSCALDQNLLFRPTPATPGHGTPVERLWHIGASTHPGPGPRRGLRLPRREAPHAARRSRGGCSRSSRACRDALAERDLDRRGELPRRPPRVCGRRASTGSASGR